MKQFKRNDLIAKPLLGDKILKLYENIMFLNHFKKNKCINPVMQY